MADEKDNGQKTKEQLAVERLERYKKEPNAFIEAKPEIIVCVIRTPRGPMAYIAGTKPELQVAWAELNMRIPDAIKVDMMKKKPLLHQASSFLSGLRGMK